MNDREQLHDLISDFSSAMLITQGLDGDFQARPMSIADSTDVGEIWFVTSRSSRKVFEVEEEPRVAVTMQSGTKFITVQGCCRIVDDQQQVDRLWKEAWRVWFPGGKEDPQIVLLQLRAEEGEYWDMSGLKGLKFLVRAGRAYFNGEKLDASEASHSVVEFESNCD